MKSNLNANIRMTDALERELLAKAIQEHYEYPLDASIKKLLSKVATFFKNPRVTHSTTTRVAH